MKIVNECCMEHACTMVKALHTFTEFVADEGWGNERLQKAQANIEREFVYFSREYLAMVVELINQSQEENDED